MNPLVMIGEGCDEAGARATRAPAKSVYLTGMNERASEIWLFPVVGMIALVTLGFAFAGHDSFSVALDGMASTGVVFGYMAYRRSIEGRPWGELGFVTPNWDDLRVGLAAAALNLATSVLCLKMRLVPAFTDSNIKTATVTGSFAVAALCLSTSLNAFAEECIFRAYLIPRLEAFRGTMAAVLISAILFGLMHLTGAIPTALGGVIFAAAFLRRRSVWASWIAHSAHNLTVLLTVHYYVAGLR